MSKFVYLFGGGSAEGNAKMKDLLGGKGANLAEMASLGIPVPPGFTISTEVCTYYYKNKSYPEGLKEQVLDALKKVEEMVNKKFGDPENPLLVSVRSGARVSMPGMMDTVLNLGINDKTVEGLAKLTNNQRFAWDSYRRFIQMFGNVVMGIDSSKFEHILSELKKEKGATYDTDLSADDLKELVERYKKFVREEKGEDFPQDPYKQLWMAIDAVFESWDNERAIAYRRMHHIPDDWGTAVNVVAMVYGNMGDDSATGVAFTRDPATGKKKFFGEFLINAQGEDVVAGIRTPQAITLEDSRKWAQEHGISEEERKAKYPSLEEYMPEVYKELVEVYQKLEKHYRDMQDLEFTIERGKLWMLQTRTGKRTGFAAVNIAIDMVDEGLITPEEAILRIEGDHLTQLMNPIFDPEDKKKAKSENRIFAKGLPAGPGAATGKVVFFAEDAEEWAAKGEKVILVREETSPEDIKGMNSAEGILTARGGMTSHAAVVARGMGKTCIVGCGALEIDYEKKEMKAKDTVIKEGDWISIDGNTGEVIKGQLKVIPSEVVQVLIEGTLKPEDAPVYQKYAKLMKWADEFRKLGVRTNADTPKDSAVARKFGAEGIGLCRTEHMFFEGERIQAVREMILADDLEGRKKALAKILPMQREDFIGIFKEMAGFPVTIRLLDPPLHEFLPHTDEEIKELAKEMGISYEDLKNKVESLKEMNPMLGHRGCRLGISYPEITEMQTRAILEAAIEVKKEGINVEPEIMVPLVGHHKELELQKEVIVKTANEVFKEKGEKVDYLVGTMIELPRAALTADEIAQTAQFFSFGTNDLTQTTFGLSRDDAGKFLPEYIEKGIYTVDPFVAIDQKGLGELIKIGVNKGRSTNPNLKIGICGEHGGEPSSVKFCHRTGFNYVSCSPYRVPVARLAAAQASIEEKKKKEN